MPAGQGGKDFKDFRDKYPSLQTVKDAAGNLSAPVPEPPKAVVKAEKKDAILGGNATVGDPHREGMAASAFTSAMSDAISQVNAAGNPSKGAVIIVTGGVASSGGGGTMSPATVGGGGGAEPTGGGRPVDGTFHPQAETAEASDIVEALRARGDDISVGGNVALASADLDYGPDDVNIDLDEMEKSLKDAIRAMAVSFRETVQDRMDMDGLYSPRRDRIAGFCDFDTILGKTTGNGIGVALHERLGGEIAREQIKASVGGGHLGAIAGVISASTLAQSRIAVSRAELMNNVGNRNAQLGSDAEIEGFGNDAQRDATNVENQAATDAADLENNTNVAANGVRNQASVSAQNIEAQSEVNANKDSNDAAAYAETKGNEGAAAAAQIRDNASVEASYIEAISRRESGKFSTYGAWGSVIAAVINHMGKPGIAWVD